MDQHPDFTLAARSSFPVLVAAAASPERFACARFIHNAGSRRLRPFLAVTCDASQRHDAPWDDVADGGAGAVCGWLTRAMRGTLFIDSIEDMSAGVQGQLAEALDHLPDPDGLNPFGDVRIITGARRRWSAEARQKRFNERLFYRLNVLRVEYPPVQGRREATWMHEGVSGPVDAIVSQGLWAIRSSGE
ncbi:MAG: sigma 54-interacting transcriptional regulator [Vicinamibacterales bacterium]